MARFWKLAAAAAMVAVSSVEAISQISVKGSKFFTDDGNQFFIKGMFSCTFHLLQRHLTHRLLVGVAYQLTEDDPLIDTNQCQLDASLMQKLGANTIRVYHVDPTGDHKGCMDAFADAGIYLFVDLDTFDTAIEQESPRWNTSQLNAFEQVLDEFQKYDNTAGVLVGNEVLTTGNGSVAAPYVKAAARDVKAYRDSKNYRNIPVGYSAADIASLRPMLQNYLACGTNSSEALDFFSLNAYEWCGSSSYTVSGYSQLTANVTKYNIPIFFSETGCNTNPPRTFQDQSAIFGDDMSPYWSGAIVYEWIEETNNYGLVNYGPKVAATATGAIDGFPRSGTPTPVSPDFSNLMSQWATATPSGTKLSDYTPTNQPPACPASTSGIWEVDPSSPLPTLGQTYKAAAATSSSGASGTSKQSPTGTTSSTSPTATKKGSAASGGKEVAGMTVGLAAVMFCFVWWL
ncbi:glycoside hydrolase family 72 protein [Xylona heveae TC161]|uniref:1,3-beta-glucanosyltransferase n=1 Tax=Xylona heveae (strain CBS 132557 / TC161) TaxID=1328760 RepID=A0A165IRV0_XYLHT|nr:glycoside hydrolase family 72 protein [Xylona heveae TC161]KZF25294.1 glycoside hydrolase family 72 protein [Xylona heveae TC161]